MKNEKGWKFRGDLSAETRKKVDLIQGFAQTKGKKITQSKALDLAVMAFKGNTDYIEKFLK